MHLRHIVLIVIFVPFFISFGIYKSWKKDFVYMLGHNEKGGKVLSNEDAFLTWINENFTWILSSSSSDCFCNYGFDKKFVRKER